MNVRRRLVFALGIAVSTPRTMLAQVKKPPVVIGWLVVGAPENIVRNLAAFKESLTALGWKEGEQFVIEARSGEGDVERLRTAADELAKRKPAVVVAGSSRIAILVAEAAPDIPIVQAGGTDPVQAGLAKSLARPGGMVTGVTQLPVELSVKLIELLVDVAPKHKRVGVLVDGNIRDSSLWVDSVRRVAAHHGVQVHFAYPARAEEIGPAIAELAKQDAQALVAVPSILLDNQRARIIAFAQAQRWPMVAWSRPWVEQGALVSYGVDGTQNYRRVAYFVDRILKGTKPGDLPIEQPMTFELAINMKSAKALGLTIPAIILVRATHVIQ